MKIIDTFKCKFCGQEMHRFKADDGEEYIGYPECLAKDNSRTEPYCEFEKIEDKTP